jgi:dolichol-phosphate mannosyltransferase
MTDSRLYVIAPLLDEAPNLPRLFDAFREIAADRGPDGCSIVLVDDGSTDGTAIAARELANGLDLTVLEHGVNHGPGAAFGTAFEFLADRLAVEDRVLTLEGDNTSRHEILGRMLHRADEGYDVVLASPYMYGGGIVHTAPLRMTLSHVANAFVKEFLGAHGILTVSSFYRLHSGDCIMRLQARYGPRIVERAGFESMVEMLMKMINLEMTICEVPMVLDTSRRIGASKLKLARTVRGYLALYRLKRRWQRPA